MKYLVIALLVALFHYTVAEGYDKSKPAANQPAYRAVYQPYQYQTYGSSGYDNAYRNRYGTYGQYPSTSYDWTSQNLHLSGGIYRPYDYSDTYGQGYKTEYKPYNYDSSYKYYDDSAARYVRYPYGQHSAVSYN